MDLESVLTLDARDYTRAADKAARANEDLDESATQASRGLNKAGESGTEAANDLERTERTSEDTSESLFELDAGATAAAGGMIAAGAAAQQALDSTKQWRTNLNQTATTANLTDEEVRELAASITDASLRMGEASQTLNLLASRGVDTEDDLKELTQQFNAVAEATGTKLPEATRVSIQAMRAFGDEAEDIEENADTLVTVSRQTGLEFREVGDAVADIQPFVDELGLTLEDTAAILLALEEQGLNAQRSQELLARAAEESDGSMKNLRNRLELTTQDLNEQRQVLRRNSGAVVRLSQDHRDALSPVDRLRSSLDDSKVAAAGATAVFEFLPPLLTAAGGASLLLANTQISLAGAFGLSAGAAAATIGTLALGVGVLAALATNFAGFRDRAVAGLIAVEVAARALWEGFKNTSKATINTVTGWFADGINDMLRKTDSLILKYNQLATKLGKEPLPPLRVEGTDFEMTDIAEEFSVEEELNEGLLQVSEDAEERFGSDTSEGFSGAGGSMIRDMIDEAVPSGGGTSPEELFGESGAPDVDVGGGTSSEELQDRIDELSGSGPDDFTSPDSATSPATGGTASEAANRTGQTTSTVTEDISVTVEGAGEFKEAIEDMLERMFDEFKKKHQRRGVGSQ